MKFEDEYPNENKPTDKDLIQREKKKMKQKKEMDLLKNIVITLENYHLKENIQLEQDGMEKEKNIMIIMIEKKWK